MQPHTHTSTRSIPFRHFTAAHRPSSYDRTRDLPRLLAFWPNEIAILDPEAQRTLVNRLRRALRSERRRGIAGHWTYNLARHADLLRAYRAELELSGKPARTPETANPKSG
jgi:hypothetical protein